MAHEDEQMRSNSKEILLVKQEDVDQVKDIREMLIEGLLPSTFLGVSRTPWKKDAPRY